MMDDKYLATLEFFEILGRLAQHTSFSASEALALALRPSSDAYTVRQSIQETTEAKALVAVRSDVTIGGAHDVRALAGHAAIDATLQPPDLLDVRSTLISGRRLRRLLEHQGDAYPLLADKASLIDPLDDVIDAVDRCLDGDGNVRNSASAALARIRREKVSARERLLERLHRIISGDLSRYLQEPIVTQRNGRFVVPLRTEFKGRIPGITHDQSSSGATLFIEPLATVELNNRWHELQLEEQREVQRILDQLSAMVGAERDSIVRIVELIAELDLAFAKARYSFAIKAAPAETSESGWSVAAPDESMDPSHHPVYLIQARHPLLPMDTVVANDIYLGGNFTVLVVTGPNTGGKTVTLKTVGLLAAMSQAGLHIPAISGSVLPIFDGIFADIGDEQSIQQSLSTFSSHMGHIVDILQRAREGSLVLLDELGAGTDPVEGAALAQALIDTLIDRRCLALCSSHYSRLKVFAFETPGVQNASVEFDIGTLSPTFRLTIGLPGQSNAFAIARQLGLEESIITRASALVTAEDLEADMLLANVKSASDSADRTLADAERQRKEADQMHSELRRKLANIEMARRKVLEEAREQGRDELDQLRRDIRRLRPTLTKGTEAGQAVRQITEAIDRLADQLPHIETEVASPREQQGPELEIGDTVLITTLGKTGQLLQLSDTEAEVAVGGFRLKTQPTTLEFHSHREQASGADDRPVGRPVRSSPGIELDIRGFRAQDVAPVLDRYLDDAYLSALPWVHVIHGKGTGVLKQVVRQQLTGHALVDSFRRGELTEGGDGVTVVKLHAVSD